MITTEQLAEYIIEQALKADVNLNSLIEVVTFTANFITPTQDLLDSVETLIAEQEKQTKVDQINTLKTRLKTAGEVDPYLDKLVVASDVIP